MGMKLLPKSEIDKKKAAEQYTAVEEGLKLARRVDNLREVAADEEQSLSEYRIKTLTAIHEETKEAAEKRDSLQKEVADLEDRKREALKPLDQAWEDYKVAKLELQGGFEDLNTRVSAVSKRETDAEATTSEANRLLAVAVNREHTAFDTVRDNLHLNEAAQLALKDATRIQEEAIKRARQVEGELMHRESVVSSRERGATIREQAVAKDEQFIRDEKARLRDREATLERAFNRIKK